MESVSQIERAGARSKAQWGRNQVMGETAGNWNDWAHGHRPDSAKSQPLPYETKNTFRLREGEKRGANEEIATTSLASWPLSSSSQKSSSRKT